MWIGTMKKETKETYESEDGEVEEWFQEEYATATNAIYEINASNTALSKTDVENLSKGDLAILRNSIYARHGYSFKRKAYRVFF